MHELVDIVKDYIQKRETDYALLINGKWGSGKTYFWKHKLVKEIEKIEIDRQKIKTLYVSVFGIGDLSEISKKIFFELMPFLNLSPDNADNKSLEIVKQAVMNGASTFGIKLDLDDFFQANKEILYQLRNCVLCIDDIERSTRVDITEILGYVNSLVEHDNLKVILIGNEDEINKSSHNEAYDYIKEKTIGKTINFISEIDSILEDIINLYSEDSAFNSFLSAKKELILNTFYRSPEQNLRILKHAIADFYTIFKYLEDQYPDKALFVGEKVLTLTLATSFELKLGNANVDTLRSVTNNSLLSTLLFQDRKEESFENQVINRYFLNKDFYWFTSIVEYVISGLFDKELFAQEVQNLLVTKEDDQKTSFELFLSEYWELSDEEFDSTLQDVIAKVKENKFPLTHLPLIFYVLSYFADQGLINNLDDIALIFKNSISNIPGSDAYFVKEFEQSFKTFERKIFSEDYLRIKQLAIEQNKDFKEKEISRQSKDIIGLFPDRLDEFLAMCKSYQRVPFFKYADPGEFFAKILGLSNLEIAKLSACLDERYSAANFESNAEEFDNLSSLQEKLKDYLNNQKVTLKNHLLKQLTTTLTFACNSLNRSGSDPEPVPAL